MHAQHGGTKTHPVSLESLSRRGIELLGPWLAAALHVDAFKKLDKTGRDSGIAHVCALAVVISHTHKAVS